VIWHVEKVGKYQDSKVHRARALRIKYGARRRRESTAAWYIQERIN